MVSAELLQSPPTSSHHSQANRQWSVHMMPLPACIYVKNVEDINNGSGCTWLMKVNEMTLPNSPSACTASSCTWHQRTRSITCQALQLLAPRQPLIMSSKSATWKHSNGERMSFTIGETIGSATLCIHKFSLICRSTPNRMDVRNAPEVFLCLNRK